MASYRTYSVVPPHSVPEQFKRPYFLASCRGSHQTLRQPPFPKPFHSFPISPALSFFLFLFPVLLTYCPPDLYTYHTSSMTSPNRSILIAIPSICLPHHGERTGFPSLSILAHARLEDPSHFLNENEHEVLQRLMPLIRTLERELPRRMSYQVSCLRIYADPRWKSRATTRLGI
jgi:hypothetical protein